MEKSKGVPTITRMIPNSMALLNRGVGEKVGATLPAEVLLPPLGCAGSMLNTDFPEVCILEPRLLNVCSWPLSEVLFYPDVVLPGISKSDPLEQHSPV